MFTEFDAASAGPATLPYGINDAGAVTGYYLDVNFMAHGFVRNPSAVLATFDAPVSGESGTYAYSVNDAGVVAGFYFQNGESFSFVRAHSAPSCLRKEICHRLIPLAFHLASAVFR